MSFFDKLFSNKNRNYKNENTLKTESETFSFKSTHLNISKDQIRFILFRECDRRGRKLLFDSDAVEKIPLPTKGIMCNQKCQKPESERIIDFTETTSTHGYKYKKPSSDVACLGEMIFGSVAMVYKGENSCKIHSIPSPRQLMFTTIVHAPNRCPINNMSYFSADSGGSSFGSLGDANPQQTSSSDSKLYRKQGVVQKYSSTYPSIRHNSPLNTIVQCCQINDLGSNLVKKNRDSELDFLGCLCLGNQSTSNFIAEEEKKSYGGLFPLGDFSNFSGNSSHKNSDCSDNIVSSVVTSTESENVSSVSGSLSSLRRRWTQSVTTSLESITHENTYSSPSKKRTKLGMAIVLDLSNTLEDEIEKFLFNHTIIIDSIISKLQSSVELAYIKNENFVDVIYTAFQESQQSIYELITGPKYDTSLWCTLLGEPDNSLETHMTGVREENMRANKKQDLFRSIQLKFLDDFCDILVKFDTKDTNFFVSTLLTAVLTHHLSWVSTVAETDASVQQEKSSVINNLGPYNPLWAQLNDLCGLLGSPLKSAKTIITGAENQKSNMASIIQSLTYFIRCHNILENIYEMDLEDMENIDLGEMKFLEIFDSDFESDGHSASVTKKNLDFRIAFGSETEKSSDEEFEKKSEVLIKDCFRNLNVSGGSLKRNKSVSSLKREQFSGKLYPDIKDLAKSENICVSDLFSAQNEKGIKKKVISSEELAEKVKKMIRVPENNENSHLEGYLSSDEGYDTIESTKTENLCTKVQMERQFAAPTDSIVFVLGDNEELVNLPKKVVVTKSSVIDIENENCDECDNIAAIRCEDLSAPINKKCSENLSRTLGNDKTWVSCDDEKKEHSQREKENKSRTPWIRELKMPKSPKRCRTRRLEVSSVLGGVNQQYNSEQVIQGVLDPFNKWEHQLQKDLFLSSHNSVLETNISEAICILGDMDSWEVSIYSSSSSSLSRNKQDGVRVGMSQLVADMLESFLYLHTINLPPNFCLLHIEKKLYEIYSISKAVAELLNSTELCNIDYLTTRLDIGINDVPLLLSVATTHSPHISEKYGLSFT